MKDYNMTQSVTRWYRPKLTTIFTVHVNIMMNVSPFVRKNEQNCNKHGTEGATFMHTVRNTSDAKYAPTLNPISLSWSYNIIQTLLIWTSPPGS